MFRCDFQKLTTVRLHDARLLLDARSFDEAYHLGGLAVECALKACTARSIGRYEFPDRGRVQRFYTHNLEGLLKEAALEVRLRSATRLFRLPGPKSKGGRLKPAMH